MGSYGLRCLTRSVFPLLLWAASSSGQADSGRALKAIELGKWDDLAVISQQAWRSSRNATPDFPALLQLQYAYLQQGKYKAARALLDTARAALRVATVDTLQDQNARFAICDLAFRYSAETGDWVSFAANAPLPPPVLPSTSPGRPGPVTPLRTRSALDKCEYARVTANAMLTSPTQATAFVREVRRFGDTLAKPSPAGLTGGFWVSQLQGFAAHAREDRATAIEFFTAAAKTEAQLAPAGPPVSIPPLELVGLHFMAGGRAADAATAYEQALKLRPNRSAALLGLARARARLGQRDEARDAYAKVLTNWQAADADVPGLPEARREGGTQARGAPAANETLPAWTPGTLDIHHISTGRGNATLFVLPDGTTLLVDAGAAGDGVPETDPHPDASRSPGEWIARYVKRHIPDSTAGLDYALITHFHSDHYGQVVAKSPSSRNGPYKLSGITEVGDALRIRSLIDRGWPDYSYPTPITDSTMANYRRFLEAQKARGMLVSKFLPGSRSQIRLRDTTAFPTFEIRNIVGNGDVWTGSGEIWRNLFPHVSSMTVDDLPSENMCSLGFRLSYGPFRYFTGGDLPGTADPGFPAWHALEPAVAALIGKVDVHVVNQHGSIGEETDSFLRTLESTVLVIPSWAPSHPAPDVLKRIMNSRYAPLPRYVFVTDMRDAARTVIGQRANSIAGPPGHIVVRVAPGGTRYQVFVLSNKDENDAIVATKGPFNVTPR